MKTKIFITALLIIFIASCSTTTKIIGSWVEPEHSTPVEYKKIAVIALAKNKSSQLVVEQSFVNRLKFLGYDAIETNSFLVPEVIKKENAEMIDKMMKERGVDAVIILSLLQIKDGVRYVQGTTYNPGPYYGGYYGYYYNNYGYMNQPGYYEETKSIYIESNFYDLEKGKLLSSIQTETVDPTGVDDLADTYSATILQKLITDKILVQKTPK